MSLDHRLYLEAKTCARMTSADQILLCRDALQSYHAEKTEIKHETLRIIIECCRKKDVQVNLKLVLEVCSQLITFLAGHGLHLESQMLCSTAFCVALTTSHSEEQSLDILRKCLEIDDLGQIELELVEGKCLGLTVRRLDVFKLCLCHGILQSRFPVVLRSRPEGVEVDRSSGEMRMKDTSSKESDPNDSQPTITKVMLKVIVECCSKYSHLTHLAFRVLAAWLERLHRVNSASNEVYEKVFHVIFTNWESPMNGVREQNTRILELLIDIHPKRLHTLLMEVLQHQPWTIKSKYLVLAVLLPKYGVAKALSESRDLPLGLMYSLRQSHLVSAGCDAYRACVLQLDEREWSAYFLSPIMGFLAQEQVNTSNDISHLFNYWMPVTLKRFPSLASTLLSRLTTDDTAAILHILKLSQGHHSDLGQSIRLQCGVTIPISDLIRSGIKHTDETIRQLSFAVVCLSSKTTITPSTEEFQFVVDFLTENMNVDSAPFRQSVCNSFTSFLRRIWGSNGNEFQKDTVSDKKGTLSHLVTNANSLKMCCDKTVVLADECTVLMEASNESHLTGCVARATKSLVSYKDLQSNLFCHNKSGIKQIVCFLEWFNSFLLSNLEPGTNYQRKILSLRLYQLVLKTIVNVGNQKLKGRNITYLVDHETRCNKWHFKSRKSRHVLLSCILNPTEDIRETAGAILLEYFCVSSFSCDPTVKGDRSEVPYEYMSSLQLSEIVSLLDKGLYLCGSSKFYETESGALLLKIVAAWVYKREQMAYVVAEYPQLQQHVTLTLLLRELARQQWSTMQAELFAAASSGCPVHGIVTALTRVAMEMDGPEYHITSWEDKQTILNLVEDVVEHLLSVLASKAVGVTEYAPSFAEMGEAIDSATQQESSDVQLSAAHQLLLNCVWLNFKACCQLASAMGSCHPDIDMATQRRCARIITNVLTRCRHKGAIESAGLALGRLVQVASVSKNQALPAEILSQFLDSQTGGASVTRRSAGLAILVHRIVASDMQQGKPLVSLAVTRLISVASAPVDEANAELSDLPQAQALHFLRTLVQDASLRQNMAPFISQVAMLCFENFASPIWTIRNAALQLFGAVASKLVGQKKAHDDDVVGTLEELSAHFPTLLSFLLSRLQEALSCPELHPTLVPNLSLLSKMSLNHPYLTREYAIDIVTCTGSYVNSCSMLETQGLISSLTQCLFQLLPSHVQTVRKLAAKGIANFTPFPLIEKFIISLINSLSRVEESSSSDENRFLISGLIGENQLNGLLLTLQYLTGRFLKESTSLSCYSSSIRNITEALGNLRQLRFRSHYNFALALQLLNFTGCTSDVYSYDYCVCLLDTIMEEVASGNGSVRIGFYQWGSVEIELILRHCPDKELFDCFIKVLTQPKNFACDILLIIKTRLSQESFPVEEKLHILSYSFSLLTAENVAFRPLPLLKIMLLLSSQTHSVTLPLQRLDLFYNRYVRDASYGWKCSAVGLSVVSNYLGSLIQASYLYLPDDMLMFLINITNSITGLCCPLSSDEDQRLNAAVSLGFLSTSLLEILQLNPPSGSPIVGSVFKTVFNSCIMLLQDENSEVRKEAAKFASQILHHSSKVSIPITLRNLTCVSVFNPYNCLQSMFSADCLTFWLGEDQALLYLWLQLDYSQSLEEMVSKKGKPIVSPFDHGTSNVYAEKIKIVEWSLKTLTELLRTVSTDKRDAFVGVVNLNKPSLEKAWPWFSELVFTNAMDPDSLYVVAKQISCQIGIFDETDSGFVLPSWTSQLQEFLHHHGLVL